MCLSFSGAYKDSATTIMAVTCTCTHPNQDIRECVYTYRFCTHAHAYTCSHMYKLRRLREQAQIHMRKYIHQCMHYAGENKHRLDTITHMNHLSHPINPSDKHEEGRQMIHTKSAHTKKHTNNTGKKITRTQTPTARGAASQK